MACGVPGCSQPSFYDYIEMCRCHVDPHVDEALRRGVFPFEKPAGRAKREFEFNGIKWCWWRGSWRPGS